MRFFVAFTLLVASIARVNAADPNVNKRGSLVNSRIVFETQKKGHVAFMGGSITEMNGYRPMVCEVLQQKFPNTQFTFTAAGISSTCSTTGAFRLQDDVLSKGPVDLFFVEFAVNDDQDAHHTREECIRGMEGIIRHVRKHNPKADIVITYFLNESSIEKYKKGETPLPIQAHEEVANHYQISSINLAKTVTTRISAGEFDWKKFGGVHPAPFGNRIAADMIKELLDSAWSQPLAADAKLADHPMPEKPVDEFNYGGGKFLNNNDIPQTEGWESHVPDWANIPGGKRKQFTDVPMIEATKPGSTLSFNFNGNAVGAFVVAGPDAGMLEASIDGGETRKVNLFHQFSAGLHYPRTVMLGEKLTPGPHKISLKISEDKDPQSKGHAVRVFHFVVNEAAK